jgi:hypothetical protein
VNELNENALDTAIKSLSYNSQNRVRQVKNLGAEMKLIEQKKCTLSARTRAVLVELADRMAMNVENKVLL